jgi:hypothetical protein
MRFRLKNDEDLYSIGASDEKGHNTQVGLRVPPGWMAHIETVIESRIFPLKNKGYLMRAALYFFFHYLETLENIPNTTLGQLDAMIKLLTHDGILRTVSKLMPLLEQTVNEYRLNDGDNIALTIILQILDLAKGIPDNYWRKRITEQVRTKYGDLINKADDASLVDFSEDEDKEE